MNTNKLKDTKFHKLYYEKFIFFVVGNMILVAIIFFLDFCAFKRFNFLGFIMLTILAIGLSCIEIYTRKKGNNTLLFLSVLFCISLFLILMYGNTNMSDMSILKYHIENIVISLASSVVGIIWGLTWVKYRGKLEKEEGGIGDIL